MLGRRGGRDHDDGRANLGDARVFAIWGVERSERSISVKVGGAL
jgi:hypothetical protein